MHPFNFFSIFVDANNSSEKLMMLLSFLVFVLYNVKKIQYNIVLHECTFFVRY